MKGVDFLDAVSVAYTVLVIQASQAYHVSENLSEFRSMCRRETCFHIPQKWGGHILLPFSVIGERVSVKYFGQALVLIVSPVD